MRVYRRNRKLKLAPCSVKSVPNKGKKFEETGSHMMDCNPVFLSKLLLKCIIQQLWVNVIQQEVFPAILNLPKTTVLQILRSVLQVFPHRFQRVQELEPGNNQQRTNFFLIRYDEGSRSLLRIMKGWDTFHSHWETPRIAFNGRKKTLAVWHQCLYTTDT